MEMTDGFILIDITYRHTPWHAGTGESQAW